MKTLPFSCSQLPSLPACTAVDAVLPHPLLSRCHQPPLPPSGHGVHPHPPAALGRHHDNDNVIHNILKSFKQRLPLSTIPKVWDLRLCCSSISLNLVMERCSSSGMVSTPVSRAREAHAHTHTHEGRMKGEKGREGVEGSKGMEERRGAREGGSGGKDTYTPYSRQEARLTVKVLFQIRSCRERHRRFHLMSNK